MEENDNNAASKGGLPRTLSDNDQAVRYYKPLLTKALIEIQQMMTPQSEDWNALETLVQDVSRETRGVVLYHKLIELNKVITEESRGM